MMHYDRMNWGCSLKDIFYLNNQVYKGTVEGGLAYNTVDGLVWPALNDEDIMFHPGMTLHILTGGIIKAACHGVILPNN